MKVITTMMALMLMLSAAACATKQSDTLVVKDVFIDQKLYANDDENKGCYLEVKNILTELPNMPLKPNEHAVCGQATCPDTGPIGYTCARLNQLQKQP
jgi:hypothetical protein